MSFRENLRSLAIVAHVDHGKTTLVDALFQQGGVYRKNQEVTDRVMDSNDQERERGITILAKTTSVDFNGYRLQLVDTPGHADFGGEVERTLNLVDGILLLVDAAEGPLPQTRFVLRKAFEKGLKPIVVINKIDRADARAPEVLDEVYDLFIDLGVDEDALDFPVVYTVARDGTATLDLDVPGTDLQPLVESIIKTIPASEDRTDGPFQMTVNQLGYDEYVGRLVVGRIHRGRLKPNQQMAVMREEGVGKAKCTGLFSFRGVERIPLEHAQCGDIIAIAGVQDVTIGDTLCDPEHLDVMPRISVDEPTVSMVFQVNDGPFSGLSGKYVTSRQIRDRLSKEAFANVSIRIGEGDSPDQFRVMGRGELQLSVLIESLRREGFELCVRNPEVVTQGEGDARQEPTERLVIDVPVEHLGAVTSLLGGRKATMLDQKQEGGRVRLEYIIPTRGLFGMRGIMLTVTRGTAIANSVFEGWVDWQGPIPQRSQGAIVSDRQGSTTPYALFNLQPRGTLFIGAGADVYEGMVVGENSRPNDLNVNCVREKKMTNVRASGKDDAVTLAPARQMTLEKCLEWIRDDEMVEVTPDHIRIRKRALKANKRSVQHPDA